MFKPIRRLNTDQSKSLVLQWFQHWGNVTKHNRYNNPVFTSDKIFLCLQNNCQDSWFMTIDSLIVMISRSSTHSARYLLSTYHPILWNVSPLTLVRHDGQLFTSLTRLHKQRAWHWLKTCCFDIQIICQFTRMSRHRFITKLMMEAWHKNIIKTMMFGGCWNTNAPLTSSPMSQIWPIRGQHDSSWPIRGPEWF